MKKSAKNESVKNTVETVKAKRKYTKRAAKWNLAKECLAAAKKDKKMRGRKAKKVVMKNEAKPMGKRELKALKKAMDAEKQVIRQIKKNCKLRAKELAKLDEVARQKMIAKLMRLGYMFDVSDPMKLVISIDAAVTIIPKMKKVGVGGKAVSEKKAVAQVDTPAVEQPSITPAEVVAEAKIENTTPVADVDVVNDEEPTAEDLAAIEAEEDEQMDDGEMIDDEDEKAAYREEFYAGLAEEGDDSNF